MSSLGIKFVLPYVGVNGLKVTNNKIGLDENGIGDLGALRLNLLNSFTGSNNLEIYCSSNIQSNAIAVIDNVDGNNTVTIDNNGGINNGISIGATFDGYVRTDYSYVERDVESVQGDIFTDIGDIKANGNVEIVTGNLLLDNTPTNQGEIHFNESNANISRFLLNKLVNGVVAPSTARYIPIVLDGVNYKLIIAT